MAKLSRLSIDANDENVTKVAFDLIQEERQKREEFAGQFGIAEGFTREHYDALMSILNSINPEDAIH